MFGFGKKEKKVESVPAPLGFRVGAAVTLTELDFKLMGPLLAFDFPGSTHMIKARGFIDFGYGIHIHRFYSDEPGVVFQVVTENGNDDENVTEIKLLVNTPYFPASKGEWEQLLGKQGGIGEFFFEYEGRNYSRVWVEDSEEKVDPIEVSETIGSETGEEYKERKLMLYGRFLQEDDDGDNPIEWLQISAVDSGDAASIDFELGVDLTEGDFEVM
jgi:hypothetical protein